MILEMTATATDAFRAHGDQGLLDRTLDTLGDLFSHHISNSTGVATRSGLDQFAGFVQLPPGVQSITSALAGKEVRLQPAETIANIVAGRPATAGTAFDTTASKQVPGQVMHDQLLSDNDGSTIHALLAGLFGTAGGAFADLGKDFMTRWQAGFEHPWSDLMGDYKQSLMDQAPYANVIWGNQIKASTSTPLEQSVRQSLTAMKATAGADSQARTPAFTREGGLPVAPFGNTKFPDDPVLRHMFMVTSRVYSDITSRNMPMVNDLLKQKEVIINGPQSADIKRMLLNDIAAKLQIRYEQIDRRIANLNSGLSTLVGAHVDVRSINWHGTADQFTQSQ